MIINKRHTVLKLPWKSAAIGCTGHSVLSQLMQLGMFLIPLTAHSSETLRLASDDWCPFVCAENGKLTGGYLVEATEMAMSAAVYQVVPTLPPLKRAMSEASHGRIEGVYAPPIDSRLSMSDPLAYSRACFYTHDSMTWTYDGLDSLRNVTVGVIDDYGYDDGPMDAYIRNNQKNQAKIEVARGEDAGTHNLQKLIAGRFPVLLEHEAVASRLIKSDSPNNHIRQAGCLEQALPLTVGFAKEDPRSALWIRALRDGLQKIDANGKLATLRHRYHILPGRQMDSPPLHK